ncbi:MAG: phosphodiester glycosidase family protein, partial [Clostridia bacterium]|nr:phosphodiester glycosidase family protein [Clostridia bacterium]
TPTPVPTPTPTPTPSPSPTPSGLLGGRFFELFTEDGEELTEDGYRSENISFTVTVVRDEETYANLVTYYLVDIYVQDVTYIRTAAAGGDFSKRTRDAVSDIARENEALVAISGDYYGFSSSGLVLRNGELYRDNIATGEDVCVLYKDGTMKTFLAGEFTLEELNTEEAWQIWSFGPELLDYQGEPKTEFNSSVTKRNPRCAIGYFEPGHYCFVVADGRQSSYSRGMTMSDLSLLMYNLGCTAAYNLDGGGSAQLFWQDEIFNSPSGGARNMSDIVYIAAEEQP